jgi:Uma2 family endonuclease
MSSTDLQQQLWYERLTWADYENIVESWEGHPLRHTLDRGTLEVFWSQYREERIKVMIRYVINLIAEELRVPIRSGGSPILCHEKKCCALNPDASYHFANERFVRCQDSPDLERYPPDLTVEVEIPGSKIDRMKIYPLFRVPEIWRYANSRLEFLALRGEYVPIERSLSFPLLTPANVMQFVNMRDTCSDTLVMNRIVRWVRQQQRSVRK